MDDKPKIIGQGVDPEGKKMTGMDKRVAVTRGVIIGLALVLIGIGIVLYILKKR
ncbi:MAG: hypothetical protein MJ225_02945 [Bacilli bacterium]|nr:hypothetical protein [Bacilli bacterium]